MADHLASSAKPSGQDPAHFRKILGHVPTSVSIVTGQDEEGPFGLVIGSLVSISLNPPLVGMFVDNGSSTLGRLLECGRMCINILPAEQARFCEDFRKNKLERFTCGSWRQDEGDAPHLERALAWISGPIERAMQIGDHHLIVIEAQDLAENPAYSTSGALVFFRGSFVD